MVVVLAVVVVVVVVVVSSCDYLLWLILLFSFSWNSQMRSKTMEILSCLTNLVAH